MVTQITLTFQADTRSLIHTSCLQYESQWRWIGLPVPEQYRMQSTIQLVIKADVMTLQTSPLGEASWGCLLFRIQDHLDLLFIYPKNPHSSLQLCLELK